MKTKEITIQLSKELSKEQVSNILGIQQEINNLKSALQSKEQEMRRILIATIGTDKFQNPRLDKLVLHFHLPETHTEKVKKAVVASNKKKLKSNGKAK